MHSTIVEPSQNQDSPGPNGSTVRDSFPFDSSPSARFHLPKRKRFAPQYAHIYFCRLTQLRPHLVKAAQRTFGPPSDRLRFASRIVDASDPDANTGTTRQTVIFGVIFRHMSSKPSILKLYDQPSHDLIPAPPARASSPYAGEEDSIFLEDENGRCTLDMDSVNPLPNAFVTGFVVAVRGAEDRSTGSFRVSDYACAQPAPQPSLSALAADRYLCVVSSLHLSNISFPTELFLEFLKGSTGDEDEEKFTAQIAHLIIAGNIVPAGATPPSYKPLAVGEKERVADPIVEADRYLSAVASALPVSVMPGEDDPANHLLPQQPLHRCLLPSSSRNSNLSRVSNPYACELGGRLVLATSGQNVSDFALYHKDGNDSAHESEKLPLNGGATNGKGSSSFMPGGDRVLDIMDSMLTNRHIAPTCPDTLGAYPFYDRDPFVVESTPHIFLAGNQREFASRIMEVTAEESKTANEPMQDTAANVKSVVRLISVPRFDHTGQAVFVNLRTLDCTVREFALSM